MITDTVCISNYSDSISCIEDFSFFHADRLLSCAIGLAPSDFYLNGPSYMNTVFNQNNLTNNTIGLSMREENLSGTAYFGSDE